MIRVAPFRVDDAGALILRPGTALTWHDRQAVTQRFAAAGRSFTVRNGDRVIACGGAVEQHARHASLWAIYGEGISRKTWGRLLKGARELIAALPHARVDALVAPGDEGAIGWAKACGLMLEARLYEANPLGGDMLLYRRKG